MPSGLGLQTAFRLENRYHRRLVYKTLYSNGLESVLNSTVRLHLPLALFSRILNIAGNMPKQRALKPIDIVVALQLTIKPGQLFASLAAEIGISVSEAHAAVQRLDGANLLSPGERSVVLSRFWDLLKFGVPCVYPIQFGPNAIGVPTGASAPAFGQSIEDAESMVWPHADGETEGVAVDPLYPRAPELAKRNLELYDRLAMLDSLRSNVGREFERAAELLAGRLGVTA